MVSLLENKDYKGQNTLTKETKKKNQVQTVTKLYRIEYHILPFIWNN